MEGARLYPLVNHTRLTQRMVPTLRRVAGADNVVEGRHVMASEDFSFFAKEVPALYFNVGITPRSPSSRRHQTTHRVSRLMRPDCCLVLGHLFTSAWIT